MKKAYLAVLAVVLCGSILTAGPSLAGIQGETGKRAPAVEKKAAVSASADKADAVKAAEEMRKNAEEAKKLVVARVNGAGISMFDLVRMMNRIAPRYVQPDEKVSAEQTVKIKKKALDLLIFEEMAIQASYNQKLAVEPRDIDKVISQVKENLGSEQAYRNYLKQLDLTEDQLKKQIERSRRRELITAKEIYGKVKVSDDEIGKEYDKLKKEGKLRTADDFVVQEILLMSGKDEKEVRKRAGELLAEAKKNKGNFGPMVLDGTFITRRMNITKERYPIIYQQMKKMKIGQLSKVVKDGGTYHIFKVVKKDPAHDLSLKEARGYIENRLREPAQEARKVAWEEELKKNAKIEILLDQVEAQLKKKAGA